MLERVWGAALEPGVCDVDPPTYAHRVDNPDLYNYCPVPGGGEDAFLFAALAAVVACLLHFSRLSAVLVLVVGALAEAAAYSFNLGRLGNAFTLWLGITPPELLLYAFLPPLLCESAMNLDWYVFKRVAKYSVAYAFVVVVATTAVVTPFMLYALGLEAEGWSWQHGALFVSMLASTDALAVAAIVRQVGGPEKVTALMEGESLFNDASSLVLFSVFLEAIKALRGGGGGEAEASVWALLPPMGAQIVRLAGGGAAVGVVLGWATLRLLRHLRATGARSTQELGLIQAMAFLTFYVANAPLAVSGVIAVVIFALYGAATAKFEMAESSAAGDVDAVLGTLSGVLNGLVFFLGGATAMNFLLRAVPELHLDLATILAIPAIYVVMFVARGSCIYLLNAAFWAAGAAPLPLPEVAFVTWGGLRGALSLIMAMVVAAEHAYEHAHGPGSNAGDKRPSEALIVAQMVAWVSAFVLSTLCINAPTMPAVLRALGLLQVPRAKARLRAKALKALARRTAEALEELRHDEDELLRGADWVEVQRYVDPDALVPPPGRQTTGDAARPPPPLGSGRGGGLGKYITRRLVQATPSERTSPVAASLRQPLVSVRVAGAAEPPAALDAGRTQRMQGSDEVPFLASGPAEDRGAGGGRGRAKAQAPAAAADGSATAGGAPRGTVPAPPPSQLNAWSDAGSAVLGGSPTTSGASAPAPAWAPHGPSSALDALRPSKSELSGAYSFAYADYADLGSEASLREGAMSHPGAPPAEVARGGEALVESRARLAQGLKRFAFGKRAEGLLSPQGARLLGLACDDAVEHAPQPLAIWRGVRDASASPLLVRLLAWLFHGARRAADSLPWWARWAAPLARGSTAWAGRYLGKAMLSSCELAVAYYMALTYSHQAQWLQRAGHGSPLVGEIASERALVAAFIAAREVEAPQHFQAIQTYRATMAVLRRQRAFVVEMFLSGVVDEGEAHAMQAPVSAKMRALEAAGPAGRGWPSVHDVLRAVPFLACLPDAALEQVIQRGAMRECARGEVVWSEADESGSDGGEGGGGAAFLVVVRGLVKRVSPRAEGGAGGVPSDLLGCGTVLGLLPAVTDRRASLPGSAPVAVEASRMHAGALVFQLPATALADVKREAAAGDAPCQRMLLQMHRAAALEVAEAFHAAAADRLAQQWLAAATRRQRQAAADASGNGGALSAGVPAGAEAGGGGGREEPDEGSFLWVQAQRYGQVALEALRRALSHGAVLELGPYQRHVLRSHTVLLAGSAQLQEAHGGGAAAAPAITQAPAVLPLLLEAQSAVGELQSGCILLTGHQGALLVVCPASTLLPGGMAGLDVVGQAFDKADLDAASPDGH